MLWSSRTVPTNALADVLVYARRLSQPDVLCPPTFYYFFRGSELKLLVSACVNIHAEPLGTLGDMIPVCLMHVAQM